MNKKNSNTSLSRIIFAALALPAVATTVCLMLYLAEMKSGETHVKEDITGLSEHPEADDTLKPQPYYFSQNQQKNLPSVYYPSAALKLQLPTLRAAADRGNAYSACVLALALDLCGRRKNELRIDEYPDSYLSKLDENKIEKMAIALNYREEILSTMCTDIGPEDVGDIDKWLLQSALAGNTKSMAKLVTPPARSGDNTMLIKEEFATSYRYNAERMLNRAAEGGDPDAIASVAFAYLSGNIESTMGNIPVKEDRVKAFAAVRALAWIRKNTEQEYLSPKYADIDYRETENSIRARMAAMSQDDLSRLGRLESKYALAYKERSKANHNAHGLLDDLPEQACMTAPYQQVASSK